MTEPTTEHEAAPMSHPDPAAPAVCVFTVVVLLLGLQFTDAIPASSALAFIPVLVIAGIGQFSLGLMATRLGEQVIGLFFCVFGCFLMSFGLLEVGLVHGWWPIPPADLPHVEGGFLIGWTVIVTLWTVLSLVVVRFFFGLLVIIDVALWLLFAGIWQSNAGLEKAAGWFLLACAVGGCYFVASRWLAWLGVQLPMGAPLLRVAGTADQQGARSH